MHFRQWKRREFITLLGVSAVAGPLAARAQQPAMPVVGFMAGSSPSALSQQVAAFREGLKEAGFIEGMNVAVEYRYGEGQLDRLPALASDLVRRQVVVLVVSGGPTGVLAAKQASTTIPIVFSVGSDPVEIGLVASLTPRATGPSSEAARRPRGICRTRLCGSRWADELRREPDGGLS